jgi:NADPH:quinone reductase
MHALTFSSFGPPDVLRFQEMPDPVLLPGHVIIETKAIGLNYADVYRRQGNYHLTGQPPYIAGYEAAGVIVTAADDSPFSVGTRVGVADVPLANATLMLAPFDKLIPLPDDISFEQAASSLLQGLTAQYLVQDSHDIKTGDTVLIHAAAGGVGLCLVQLAKMRGATVVGLTSSPEKAIQARQSGADHMLLYAQDWVPMARALGHGGHGVDVVYESVGSTLPDSMAATRIGGHIVFYGFAGGNPPLVDPRQLMDESKSITGGDLWNILTSAKERRTRAAALFEWMGQGKLDIQIAGKFALRDGAAAHALLESRKSSGKILLLP